MTRRFGALFHRQMLRHAWRHPLLTGLNILSIALGVAVFLAIQVANRGALSSFAQAAELTSGKAHLEVRGEIDDGLLPAIAAVPGVRAATPLVEGIVTLPDAPGEYLRIVGVDPFTSADLFSFQLRDAPGRAVDIERWLHDPDAMAIQTAHAPTIMQWEKNGGIRILAGNVQRMLNPIFLLEPDEPLAQADPRLAAMDIGWAQELLGKSGRLSSIQILLDQPKETEAVAQAIRALVPADVSVAPPARRSQEMATLLGAFQLNLTAMSFVSIIVGMFLIYNSVSASIVRRRVDIAILRANGATRWEIRLLFLGEAALEAAVGSALGIALASPLANVIAAPLSKTVTSLYDLVRITHLELTPLQIAAGFAVGLAAALAAAWMPASRAASYDPARVLHPGSAMEHFSPLRLQWALWAFLFLADAAGMSLYVWHGGSKVLGFVAAGAVLAGFSFLVPWVAFGTAQAARPFGLLARLGANHLVRSLHRNATTIAALAAAVAMTISVTVMIHSFRASVHRWVERTLVADLYLAPAANEITGLHTFLPTSALAWAAAQPQIVETATFREVPIRFRDQPATLSVIQGGARGELEYLEGSAAENTDAFLNSESVAISESFANKFRLVRGDTVNLATPAGEKSFQVCGVYRDFARDQGTILINRPLFDRYWNDDRLHSLALKLKAPGDAALVSAAFRKEFGGEGAFSIYNNASLRQRVFEVFDQTFAVTSILRSIAIIVAVTGVLFSLSVLVMEREREIGVLRAQGASRFQVLGIFVWEAALIGVAASITGLISGAALSMVLTWVINKAFFGWTIALTYPVLTLLTTPLWLIPAALLAALIPAWRAARIAPAAAVRFE